MTGELFDIQRYSSHDGPGIRSTVFFKGCPLRCKWCHNPESFLMQRSILFTPTSCISCRLCETVCPTGAQIFGDEHTIDREKCAVCGKCGEICPAAAIEISGRSYSEEEVWESLSRDIPFYRSSGGGVTLSGGEVLLQPDFARALLCRCKEEGLHTAVDTAGYVDWEAFRKVLPYTDLFLYDIKAVTPELHIRATGRNNGLILENYKKLIGTGLPVWVRVPVVPGYNAEEAELGKIAAVLTETMPERVELLRFHRMAESKYRALGTVYSMADTLPPTAEAMEHYRAFMAERLSCEICIG